MSAMKCASGGVDGDLLGVLGGDAKCAWGCRYGYCGCDDGRFFAGGDFFYLGGIEDIASGGDVYFGLGMLTYKAS